jgi:alkylation response protein AidB-like acyl-CoA dehydrogenase
MESSADDEDARFRKEVRQFLREHLPEDIRRKARLGQRFTREDIVRWSRILQHKGWATPGWPREWGGPGWSATQQSIFSEELYRAPAPELLGFNVNMIGPTLIAYGTEQQKHHFLPGIASLEYWFCQGFSEPGAGSDLASLRTAAVREGEHYVVNGQKIWTTQAHHANWCFLLVRTGQAARKQEGITYLLMQMSSPGVTVRPLITIDGCHEFNEVFLDNVRIPVANRVGEENGGWEYAKYLLSHERAGVARCGLSKWRVQLAREWAERVEVDGAPLSRDSAFQLRVTELEIELKALEMLQIRMLARRAAPANGTADPKSSLLKIRGSELQQATAQLLFDVAGYAGMELDPAYVSGTGTACGEESWGLTVAPNLYWLRHTSISGGTNEIQRNILAKTLLGL